MKLSPEQEEYIRCLAYVRSFRKANPAAAALARNEGSLREAAARRKAGGEKWRKYHREYTKKRRAILREEKQLAKAPRTFSEITLFDGEREIDVHFWSDGTWDVPTTQSRWGAKPPCRQTAKRWILNGFHGDLSEEPEFVRSTIAAIKASK